MHLRAPRFVFGIAVGFLLVFSSPGFARDWRKDLSFEEFQQLVQLKVGQISELNSLWLASRERSQQTHKCCEVYLAGGRLRGLMAWIDQQLSDHSLQAVKSMAVPNLEALAQQKYTDKDLILRGLTGSTFIQYYPKLYHSGWDTLFSTFFDDSLLAGGPTIEKIGVNPAGVFDPRGGLKHFYESRLVFENSAKFAPFRQQRSEGFLSNDRKVALVLRTLRFHVEFPQLKLDDQNMRALQDAVDEEDAMSLVDNYWVKKSFIKYKTTYDLYVHKSNEDFLLSMNAAHLIEKLWIANIVNVPADLADHLKLFKNYSSSNLKRLKSAAANSVPFAIYLSRVLLRRAQSAAELYSAFDLEVSNASETHKAERQKLLNENIEAFSEMKAPFSLRKKYFLEINIVNDLIRGHRVLLKNAKSVGDFIFASSVVSGNASDAYRLALSKTAYEYFSEFLKLRPRDFEVRIYLQNIRFVEQLKNAHRILVNAAQDPEQFIKAFKPAFDPPSAEYNMALLNLSTEMAFSAQKFKPAICDLNAMKTSSLFSIEACIQIMRDMLKSTQSEREFLEILQLGVNSPIPEYTHALNQLMTESVPLFAALRPSASAIYAYHAQCNQVRCSESLILSLLKQARTSDEARAAFEHGFTSLTPQFEKILKRLQTPLKQRIAEIEGSPVLIVRSKVRCNTMIAKVFRWQNTVPAALSVGAVYEGFHFIHKSLQGDTALATSPAH